ncbi:MAG: hypothetical protein B6I36_03075 [Desulfobacteraceae bacterium 4572_35.1]|nr:MAG: hypothetical protein B6I36_03075 [Desulfobacteraceae bacterium 4572_35.1]
MLYRFVVFLFVCLLPVSVCSFGGDGCGSGECTDCHSLSTEVALKLLPPGADSVDSVKLSDVGGLWEVRGHAKGQLFTLYIDFSKKYLIAGKVLRLRDGVDLSRSVDVNELNSAGAIVIGDAQASVKVFVFTDVKCSHCQKLHGELHKVVKQNPDVAFYIKLVPFISDRETVKSIVCSASNDVLDAAMTGKVVKNDAVSVCDGTAVDETLAFAKRWNIRSTPTLILPDGHMVLGNRSATQLEEMLAPFIAKVDGKK